jgi:hypothetical protein
VIVTIAVIAFLAGALAGALLLWRLLPERLKHHVDYKQRWEDAVGAARDSGAADRRADRPDHPRSL